MDGWKGERDEGARNGSSYNVRSLPCGGGRFYIKIAKALCNSTKYLCGCGWPALLFGLFLCSLFAKRTIIRPPPRPHQLSNPRPHHLTHSTLNCPLHNTIHILVNSTCPKPTPTSTTATTHVTSSTFRASYNYSILTTFQTYITETSAATPSK